MAYFFENLKNNFDFFLRNHLIFSLKNYSEKQENSDNIFVNNIQKEIYGNLKQNYDLSYISKTKKRIFLENLYYLNLFDKTFSKKFNSELRVLDIGCKNWSYVGSEYCFFKKYTKKLTMNGIELDAYRLNSNLYNRFEIAKFYMRELSDTNYIAGDFLLHREKYDYIIWILPFISEYPLVKWGLPLKYFKPDEMLEHSYNLLNKNGEILIINQGKKEYEIQKKLNEKYKFECTYFGLIEDEYNLFKNERYCCKIVKN